MSDGTPSETVPMAVHPIEQESYRILAERVDLSSWPPGPAAVAARIIHATADPELVRSLVVDESAVAAGVDALRTGAPVLCDVEMVRSGVSGGRATCLLGEVGPARPGSTRSAAAMALIAERYPSGAIVVVGCAPTALEELNARLVDESVRPALVIGVPVGFVGAATSKERLLEIAPRAGVPVIVLRGERGGAAVAVAAINALIRLAASAGSPLPARSAVSTPTGGRAEGPAGADQPALVLIGHGTRSPAGQAELREFCAAMARARPEVPVAEGFIEFMRPTLAEALETAATQATGRAGDGSRARPVVAVPLVLLGAGHMKDDGPAALTLARERHLEVRFSYARDLGVHPSVLAVVSDRVREASGGQVPDAVVVVGRGSSDPDANADLVKAARLLADGRGLSAETPSGPPDGAPPLGVVEAGFVSLAWPDVAGALERCRRLGAERIVVVPYFLFTGLLVERIAEQARAWASAHPGIEVVVGGHMGVDPRLVELAWHRYDESAGGPVQMNCDGCVYREPLPGYEHRVGAPPLSINQPPAGGDRR
jgi:precorrin isomerase/sirohydrochlorin ferrochelatase